MLEDTAATRNVRTYTTAERVIQFAYVAVLLAHQMSG